MGNEIRIVWKTPGRIDSGEITEALGVEYAGKIRGHGGFFDFETLSELGDEKRRLKEISESDIGERRKLGRACGMNLSHCTYLAMRHCKEFDRVRYYCFTKDEDEHLLELRKKQPGSIAVDFYGEKSDSKVI